LTEVARFAAERGIWVISDETYVYLNYSGREFSLGSLQEQRDRVIVVGSLSKTYAMTGWRMGFALSPAAVTGAMQKLQSQSTSNPTSIVQKAAVAALTGSQACVAEMRAEYIQLRDHMLAGLRAIDGIKCTKPDGAFYVYPNVAAFFGRKGINSPADFAKKLLHEAHVATVPGEGFGTNEHVRMSYATSQKELDRGLERLRGFLGSV
jgi:aspartate aminotransferase